MHVSIYTLFYTIYMYIHTYTHTNRNICVIGVIGYIRTQTYTPWMRHRAAAPIRLSPARHRRRLCEGDLAATARMQIYMYVCVHTHQHVCICMCVCMCVYIYILMFLLPARAVTFVEVRPQALHMCMCIRSLRSAFQFLVFPGGPYAHVWMHACITLCLYTYIHTYIHK